MLTPTSNYIMGSDSVSRIASIAAEEDTARTSHLKRGRVRNEGDESITLPRAKRQRVRTGILQPRDINIRFLDKLAEPKAIPLSVSACSDVPREFEFSETEIKILKVIGSGDHAVVYRIAAGGKTFALKVVSSRTLHKMVVYLTLTNSTNTRTKLCRHLAHLNLMFSLRANATRILDFPP